MPNDHAVGHCDTYIHTCCRFVPCGNEYWGFFFVYSLLACDLARSWRGYVQSGSRPQSALGGSLQAPLLPSAQAFPKKKTPPGEREKASQRKLQRKEPRKNKEKGAFRPLLLACRCHEQRRGEEQQAPRPARPQPSVSASTLLSSSRSRRSRSSHSDTSLPAFPSSLGGTSLPTSVVVRKSSTAWLHLLSVISSRIFHRLFHRPVSFLTFDHRIFCWPLHLGH